MTTTKSIKTQRELRKRYNKRLRQHLKQALRGGHSKLVRPSRYSKRPETNYIDET